MPCQSLTSTKICINSEEMASVPIPTLLSKAYCSVLKTTNSRTRLSLREWASAKIMKNLSGSFSTKHQRNTKNSWQRSLRNKGRSQKTLFRIWAHGLGMERKFKMSIWLNSKRRCLKMQRREKGSGSKKQGKRKKTLNLIPPFIGINTLTIKGNLISRRLQISNPCTESVSFLKKIFKPGLSVRRPDITLPNSSPNLVISF